MTTIYLDKKSKRKAFSQEYKSIKTMMVAVKGYEKKGWTVGIYENSVIIYETK